ncbi:MAG: hypothetical protein ABI599_08530 [Flavobacteriales bacterium]
MSDAPFTSESPAQEARPGQDIAIVLGLGQYANGTELPGAVSSAQAFTRWLMDPTGGGLDPFDIEMMNFGTGAEYKEPSSPDMVATALSYFNKRLAESEGRIARRLYLYASGLTIEVFRDEVPKTMLMVWINEQGKEASYVDLAGFADQMRTIDAFEEVVLLIDGVPLEETLPRITQQVLDELPRKPDATGADGALFHYFIAEGWVPEPNSRQHAKK